MLTKLIAVDHVTIYTRINSLSCAPKTSTILYVNYMSIKKEKNYDLWPQVFQMKD